MFTSLPLLKLASFFFSALTLRASGTDTAHSANVVHALQGRGNCALESSTETPGQQPGGDDQGLHSCAEQHSSLATRTAQ
jgi:hypothetical protein